MLVSKNISISYTYYLTNRLIKKDLNSIFYVVFLSSIGLIIAFYHYIIQLTQSKSVVCEIGTNSCAKIEVEYLGFITLPLMSSVCFALIFGIGLKLIIKSKKLKQNQHVYNWIRSNPPCKREGYTGNPKKLFKQVLFFRTCFCFFPFAVM